MTYPAWQRMREGSTKGAPRCSPRSWSAGIACSPRQNVGWAEAADGRGQLLFVAGEAGIGKTRLLRSAARHAQVDGFAVVRAAAFPGDGQSFAGLLLDLASNLGPGHGGAGATGRWGPDLPSGPGLAGTGAAGTGDAFTTGDGCSCRTLADPIVGIDAWPARFLSSWRTCTGRMMLSLRGSRSAWPRRLADRPVLLAGAYCSAMSYILGCPCGNCGPAW